MRIRGLAVAVVAVVREIAGVVPSERKKAVLPRWKMLSIGMRKSVHRGLVPVRRRALGRSRLAETHRGMTIGRVANQVVSRVPKKRLAMILAVRPQVAKLCPAAKAHQRPMRAAKVGDEEGVDSANRWGFPNRKFGVVVMICEAMHRVSEKSASLKTMTCWLTILTHRSCWCPRALNWMPMGPKRPQGRGEDAGVEDEAVVAVASVRRANAANVPIGLSGDLVPKGQIALNALSERNDQSGRVSGLPPIEHPVFVKDLGRTKGYLRKSCRWRRSIRSSSMMTTRTMKR